MYSLVIVNNKESKKAKSFNKNVIKNIKRKKYIDFLFNKLHKTGTYNVCKIYLSCFDDKRYILDDGINSLIYFHKTVSDQ